MSNRIKRFCGKITQEESIELQKVLEALTIKYGEEEVKHEVNYILNWCIDK